MTKVAVYIDGPFFLHGTRGLGLSMDMDLPQLLRGLRPDDDIVRTVFFNVLTSETIYPHRHEHELLMFKRFEEQGVETRRSRTEIKAHIHIDRGADVGLATEMLLDAVNGVYDRALVLSRREELAVPIRAVQGLGKKVDVVFYEYETDPTNPLREIADRYDRLDPAQVVAVRKSGPQPVFAY